MEIVNELAAEHVQICTAEPFAMLSRIRNAGAIFVGQTSPVPLGDYVHRPSHCAADRPHRAVPLRPGSDGLHEALQHHLHLERRR